ncbi:MAG: GFA family protein [Gammaproteobacteria bacterium]|nr:GFA family protein [Gammaproteobacteria bacterium]
MNKNSQHTGSCFCGAVKFTLHAEPEAMAYCHCNSCRHWSAGPVSAFTLWKPDALQVTQGEENIALFDKNPGTSDETVVSERKWCRICGGHVFTDHPTMGLIDVPAVVIEDFDFKPGFHVHYQETVHHIKDGLPKFKDLPKEAGGSGEQLPEQG